MGIVRITSVGIKNIEQRVTQRLNFLGGEGMRALLQEMGKDAVREIQKRVGTQNPGPVKDLTPRYKKDKLKKVGYIYPILFRTGYMISTMASRVRKRMLTPRWVISITFLGQHPGAKISTAELAQIHALGKGHMPKRDFIVLPKGFGWKWQKKISNAVSKAR